MQRRGVLQHCASAIWAPDDWAVMLIYSIRHRGDPRVDQTGRFEVPYHLHTDSLPSLCYFSPHALYAYHSACLQSTTQGSMRCKALPILCPFPTLPRTRMISTHSSMVQAALDVAVPKSQPQTLRRCAGGSLFGCGHSELIEIHH